MKRKAANSLVYDAKLQRVAQALENVTRVGATFASGASERFPLPGLAFKGDIEELHLPLGPSGTETSKARAIATQQHRSPADGGGAGSAAAWTVDGASLELRNPRWRAFLHERLDLMRTTLGVSPTAEVKTPLRKMVLLEAGARLCLERDQQADGKLTGVFGSFVVVLPSAFEGGAIEIRRRSTPQQQQPSHEESKGDGDHLQADEETTTWRPGVREHVFYITYAVFYDHCDCVVEPVTSGAALYLVYDLVTTTPSEVPLVAGSKIVQKAVSDALADYFDVMPAPLAKRFRISEDASRTIHEFAVERQFVYVVDSKTWEGLTGDEHQIAQSLQAFCAQSGGQYALYHVGVLCSRYSAPTILMIIAPVMTTSSKKIPSLASSRKLMCRSKRRGSSMEALLRIGASQFRSAIATRWLRWDGSKNTRCAAQLTAWAYTTTEFCNVIIGGRTGPAASRHTHTWLH